MAARTLDQLQNSDRDAVIAELEQILTSTIEQMRPIVDAHNDKLRSATIAEYRKAYPDSEEETPDHRIHNRFAINLTQFLTNAVATDNRHGKYPLAVGDEGHRG